MRVGFTRSDDLKMWLCSSNPDWITVGDALSSNALPFPILFTMPNNNIKHINLSVNFKKYSEIFNEKEYFNFLLLRDDNSKLPIFEIGTPSCKIMTIFSEFGNSFIEIIEILGFSFLEFLPSDVPGYFFLRMHFPVLNTIGELLRAICLLRASLEILGHVRGFQVCKFSYGRFPISYNFINRLINDLC